MAPLFDPSVLALVGVFSAVLSTIGYLPYLVDTAKGRTHPQRACWLIWSVLGSIALASQIHEGAMASLGFAAVQVTGTVIVFALSIFVGKGKFLHRTDWLTLAAAAIGLLLWYFTSSAAYALAITISISLLGGSMTVFKAYRDPGSETVSTWMVFWAASALAVVSVGAWDATLLAYPLYLLTLYSAILGAIALGSRRPVVCSAPMIPAE